MRIGIDAHILGKQKGGVEHTVEVLIRGLAAADFPHDYIIYTTELHPFSAGELPPNFHLKLLPHASPWVSRLLMPYYYRRDRLDVLYLQRATPLFGCPRTVLHVHDAMYATHPHLFPFWKRMVLNGLFRYSGKRATVVVTPTEASRAEIERAYCISREKIHVLPDTVDRRELYPEKNPELLANAQGRFGVSAPYVVFLGAMERNKNVHGLLDAFAGFGRSHPAYHLVLIGKWRSETRGGYSEELERQIERLGLRDRVTITGFVSKDDRRLLLCGATMMVFPSEAEGLGLPPLEAMACGIPVVATRLPSLVEAYGDALLFCDLNDPAQLIQRMNELAADADLRRELSRRGLERAARQDWNYKTSIMERLFALSAGIPPD